MALTLAPLGCWGAVARLELGLVKVQGSVKRRDMGTGKAAL